MLTMTLICASVALSGAGQLLLKRGADTLPTSPSGWLPALVTNGYVLAGLLAWTLATLLWLVVLRRTDLSFAYVPGSLNYILVPLAARWLFQEPIGGLRLAGMAVIFLGVMLTLYGQYAARVAS